MGWGLGLCKSIISGAVAWRGVAWSIVGRLFYWLREVGDAGRVLGGVGYGRVY